MRRTPSRLDKFFDSYINDVIDRDITQLSEIQRRPDLIRLLALLADRLATTISVQNISETLASPKSTIDRYIALLEEVSDRIDVGLRLVRNLGLHEEGQPPLRFHDGMH